MRSKICSLVAVALAAALATTASAATPGETCEAQKLKLSAIYASCLLKADARARKKGEAPDYAKCEEKLATKWQRVEDKAGPGVCPTEGDADVVAEIVDGATDDVASHLGGPDPDCPAGYESRSGDQVVDAYVAALNAADETLLACQYHPDAFLIADQGVFLGPAEIVDYVIQFPELFEAPIVVLQKDVFDDTGRLLWEIDGGWIVIEDGTDSFVIERGRIARQTQHGLIDFTGPPPE